MGAFWLLLCVVVVVVDVVVVGGGGGFGTRFITAVGFDAFPCIVHFAYSIVSNLNYYFFYSQFRSLQTPEMKERSLCWWRQFAPRTRI